MASTFCETIASSNDGICLGFFFNHRKIKGYNNQDTFQGQGTFPVFE